MSDPNQPIKPTDSNPTRARETVADVAPDSLAAMSRSDAAHSSGYRCTFWGLPQFLFGGELPWLAGLDR